MKYVPRDAGRQLARLLKVFPAVLVVGPRQCGKSTLVRNRLPGWIYLDLERPADLSLLAADAEGYFQELGDRVVVDEAQRYPPLFALLRHIIDRKPRKGRFVLLGSASPSLMRDVSETLAGRVGILELTPFRSGELAGTPKLADRWFWGGYPPVHALRGPRERREWFDSYVSTFLERDLPSLGLRLPAHRLRILWTMLTHVHGSLLNVSDLARSLTVSAPTVSHYLDVLEGAFMIRRLPPHFANVQKRLTKSPKLYVRDTGLLHFLAGLHTPADLRTWNRRGQSFEGLVIEELITRVRERIVRPHLAFWRTQAGAEVDLLIGDGRRLLPVEIKLGTAVDRHGLAGIRQCMQDLNLKKGWVICNAPERRATGAIDFVPWEQLRTGQVEIPLG